MKYLLLLCALFLPILVGAFSPTITEIEQPYEIITVDYTAIGPTHYLGELENYPVMYEVTSEEPFVLSASVRQIKSSSEPISFSLIAIRKNDRGGGVSEVGRQNFDAAKWTIEKDNKIGLTFWQSELFASEVSAGTYRIEISTPNNQGKYLLAFGAGDETKDYFTTLAGVSRTQQFFGYSFLKLLNSSLVYYPLGILFFLFIIERTWRYRRLILKRT